MGIMGVYPEAAPRTATHLKEWCAAPSSIGRAVLVLDALSLREMPWLLGGAQARHIQPTDVRVTGAESPSDTDQFAHALGVPSRSHLTRNGAPGSFNLFPSKAYTDVISVPFEDAVGVIPHESNVFVWHSWLDDLIHVHKKLPDQIYKTAAATLQDDGFWKFVNRLRQGRRLVITSDHGYAVSKLFSSEEIDVSGTVFSAAPLSGTVCPVRHRCPAPCSARDIAAVRVRQERGRLSGAAQGDRAGAPVGRRRPEERVKAATKTVPEVTPAEPLAPARVRSRRARPRRARRRGNRRPDLRQLAGGVPPARRGGPPARPEGRPVPRRRLSPRHGRLLLPHPARRRSGRAGAGARLARARLGRRRERARPQSPRRRDGARHALLALRGRRGQDAAGPVRRGRAAGRRGGPGAGRERDGLPRRARLAPHLVQRERAAARSRLAAAVAAGVLEVSSGRASSSAIPSAS